MFWGYGLVILRFWVKTSGLWVGNFGLWVGNCRALGWKLRGLRVGNWGCWVERFRVLNYKCGVVGCKYQAYGLKIQSFGL